MNRFQNKLAQVVSGARASNIQPFGPGSQRSRSQEAKDQGHRRPKIKSQEVKDQGHRRPKFKVTGGQRSRSQEAKDQVTGGQIRFGGLTTETLFSTS